MLVSFAESVLNSSKIGDSRSGSCAFMDTISPYLDTKIHSKINEKPKPTPRLMKMRKMPKTMKINPERRQVGRIDQRTSRTIIMRMKNLNRSV